MARLRLDFFILGDGRLCIFYHDWVPFLSNHLIHERKKIRMMRESNQGEQATQADALTITRWPLELKAKQD